MSSPIYSTYSVIHFGDVAVNASVVRFANMRNDPHEVSIITKAGVSLRIAIPEEHQKEALKAINQALEYHEKGKP